MNLRHWPAATFTLIAGLISTAACYGQHSAPPAFFQPKSFSHEAAKPALRLPPGTPRRSIALAAPSESERNEMTRKSAPDSVKSTPMKTRRVQIGFARQVPVSSASLRLADLSWQKVDATTQAAQLQLTSADATALRIGLMLTNAPPSLLLRFKGAAEDAAVFGPYTVADFANDSTYWSPVLDGDTAIIEMELPNDDAIGNASLSIPTISHLAVSGAQLKQQDPLGQIGRSGSCEVDVACISEALQQQAATAITAVARMVLVDHGNTYLCSGTLLNDSISSMTPYFFTANHCIDDGDADPAASRGSPAATAATINTYWFFQANVCNVHNAAGVTFVQLVGGAKLVGRSVDYDWALLRLNAAPPAGVTFAAWNASTIATGTATAGIHHPLGDLKKFSQGSVRGYETQTDGSSYIQVRWTDGVTEGGSSGSGLFVFDAVKNYYELRGGLYGGASACTPTSARTGIDIYSRLDVALPYLASALTPTAPNPKQQALIVEFYSASLNDYFMTTDASEIADLDNGVHAGWVRTGLTFLAYTNPGTAPADARPVCRFYVLPQVGDSHFWSASPDECAETAVRFSGSWIEESAAVFYIQVPDRATGICPVGTRPVFRFLDASNQLHHRYTAEVDVRNSIIKDGGMIQEGFGPPPAQSVMCSPTS